MNQHRRRGPHRWERGLQPAQTLMRRLKPALPAVMLASLLLTVGCGDHTHDHATTTPATAPAPPTNRIAVGETVRRNLGITFAKAEYRNVTATIRVPGHFVPLTEATRAWHGPLRGRIEMVARAYQAVKPGYVLYRLDSPAWRELQTRLGDLAAAVTKAEAGVSIALAERAQAERALKALSATVPVHAERAVILDANVKLWSERVSALEAIQQAGGGRALELAEARGRLGDARSARAEGLEHQSEHALEHARVDAALNRQGDAPSRLGAELTAARAAKDSAESAYALALRSAVPLTGLTVEQLLTPYDVPLGEGPAPDSGKVPRWRTIDQLTITADRAGVIDHIAVPTGAWIEEQTLVLTVVDPTKVRFEGQALQSDLTRLRNDQDALITAPPPLGSDPSITGKLVIGPSGDAGSRTVPIAVMPFGAQPWARPGVSTVADITVAGGDEELTIPLAAVGQSELKRLIFRRDPQKPDEVIRLDADLGVSDGTWVVINSGLKAGDEVVVQGVYELVLSSGGGKALTGHFHADGTYHEGKD